MESMTTITQMSPGDEVHVMASPEQDVIVRVTALERNVAELRELPASVAGLKERLDSLGANLNREVDGLREQTKSHQEDTQKSMKSGFDEIRAKVDDVMTTVSGITKQLSNWQAIRQFLVAAGQFVVGAAVLAEAVSATAKYFMK